MNQCSICKNHVNYCKCATTVGHIKYIEIPKEKTKCYMCRKREAVGKFLGQPFCKECVQGIEIS